MAMQCITHHGFRYCGEVQGREEWNAKIRNFAGWLLLVSVVGLTVFFVISFSIL